MTETIPGDTKRKSLFEPFARFFEKPTRPALQTLLQENYGEFDHIDFKSSWTLNSKLAKHVLGFANSGGGVLVVGVHQEEDNSLTPRGLDKLADKAEISQALKRFIPGDVVYCVIDFVFTENDYPNLKGKRFQTLLVEDLPERLPFVCLHDGDNINAGIVYVRDGTESLPANHDTLQRILNRRLATGHSTQRELTLKEHLEELRVLYDLIPRHLVTGLPSAYGSVASIFRMVGAPTAPNPAYPKESFYQFVARAIEVKKEIVLDFLKNRSQ